MSDAELLAAPGDDEWLGCTHATRAYIEIRMIFGAEGEERIDWTASAPVSLGLFHLAGQRVAADHYGIGGSSTPQRPQRIGRPLVDADEGSGQLAPGKSVSRP